MGANPPRTVVHSGVAPTVRARASLVRAMRNLDDWERAYLSGQADERGAAYLALRANVDAAKAAMTEALGGIIRKGAPADAFRTAPMRDGIRYDSRGEPLPAEGMTEAEADELADDLAAGDHFAGMPEVGRIAADFDQYMGRPGSGRVLPPGRTSGGHR